MEEFEYSTEGSDHYRPTDDRVSGWANSAENFASRAPSFASDPYDEYSNYSRHIHSHRGRSQTRRNRYNNPSYDPYSNDEFRRDPSQHTAQGGFTNSTRSGYAPRSNFYNSSQNPTITSMHTRVPGSFSRAQSLRMSQGIPGEPSISSLSLMNAPVHDQYSYSRPREDTFRNALPIDIPYSSPRRSYSRPMDRYGSSIRQNPIMVPSSGRSRGYRRSTRDSYSTDSRSYSSRSRSRSRSRYRSRSYSRSRSRSLHDRRQYGSGYNTVHTSGTHPTVVHPSRDVPTVVPIRGGNGGYVVVPAVGQSLKVVNSRQYKLVNGPSFLERLLSPSRWMKKY